MKKLAKIVCLMACLAGFSLFEGFVLAAQSSTALEKAGTFEAVQTSAAALAFPSDSTALYPFYQHLDSLQNGERSRLNILHIGASHVQAGVFSHRMRWHFAQLGDTSALPSRGLIFPYSAARTNNPPYYKVSSQGQWKTTRNVYKEHDVPLGMSGIAISTQDTSSTLFLRLNRDSSLVYHFNRIRLLTNEPSPSFIPCVDDSILGTYDRDSRTWTFHLLQEKDSFSLSFIENTFVKEFMEMQRLPFMPEDSAYFQLNGILLDNDNPGVCYHAIGVNGASVHDYIRCPHFARDMKLLQPDLVIFGIGINDATKPEFTKDLFVSQYDTLITYLRDANPGLSMIFMTNNDSYIRRKKPNEKALVARDAFAELAEKHQAALWDVFDMMGGLGSAYRWYQNGLMKPDLVHFSNQGYEYLGDCLFEAIMQDYQHYQKQKEE